MEDPAYTDGGKPPMETVTIEDIAQEILSIAQKVHGRFGEERTPEWFAQIRDMLSTIENDAYTIQMELDIEYKAEYGDDDGIIQG